MKLLEYLEKQAMLADNLLISYDELAEWPADQVTQAQQDSYLVQTDDADGITCRECPEQCWKSVEIRQKDGRNVGVFHCEEEDTAGLISVELERLHQWKINNEKLGIKSLPERKKKKVRPTQKAMADRNRSVAWAAAKFQTEHDRLPNVDDMMQETSYSQKQIYQTDAYQEGKIAKNTAKVSNEITGKSVTSSEYFSENSIEHTRATNRSKAEQDALDALIDTQKEDDSSRYVT